MKKLLGGFAALSIFASAHAALFSPESLGGAAVGAAAGALIGHGAGGHAGEGAAIGAGVGLVGGALLHESRVNHGYHGHGYHSPGYSYRGGYYSGGYYSPHYHRHGYHWGPRYSYFDLSYTPSYVEPVFPAPAAVEQPVQQAAPAPAPQPQNVTIINNYYNSSPTPMSGANGLFGR